MREAFPEDLTFTLESEDRVGVRQAKTWRMCVPPGGDMYESLGPLCLFNSNTRLFVETLENGDKQKEENTNHS